MAKKEVRGCHEAQSLPADAPRPNFVGPMQAFIYKIHLILASLIFNIARSVLVVVHGCCIVDLRFNQTEYI